MFEGEKKAGCCGEGNLSENMLKVTQNGAIIFPPVPAFCTKPKAVEDIVAQGVGRMRDTFDLDTADFERWEGMKVLRGRGGGNRADHEPQPEGSIPK